MIGLHDFSIAYGERKLLENVSTEIKDGRLTALIGRNGTGKSSLLRAVAGLNRNYSGEITVDGQRTAEMTPARLARNLAFVSTQRTRIHGLVCRDVVAAGRAPYTNWIGKLQTEDRQIVEHAMQAVGMAEHADRTMDKMSDGECQRVMVARALAQSTPNILLDEPTSFLDLPNRYELVMLLKRLAHKENKCIFFSTHELEIVMRLCDDVALMDDGKVCILPAEEMMASGKIQRLFTAPDTDLSNMIWKGMG